MVDVFNYADYRKFLADRLRDLKSKDSKYSQRYISKEVGYGSASFTADVIAGRKNLTGPIAIKLAGILDLTREAEEYFLNLVLYNQAQTIDEKNRYYEKLMAVTRIQVRVLETDKFEYFSNWYNAAIRELITFRPFDGDYRALAKRLNPSITEGEARRSIRLLVQTGLVRENGDGTFAATGSLISTGEGFASLNVANYQRAFMELAREGLDRHPSRSRDYSTLCLPIAEEDFDRARHAIAKLRNYLMALSDKCKKPNRVYHFNFQAFPLTEG